MWASYAAACDSTVWCESLLAAYSTTYYVPNVLLNIREGTVRAGMYTRHVLCGTVQGIPFRYSALYKGLPARQTPWLLPILMFDWL